MGSDSPYLDPYREAVRDGGPRFESLLWRNQKGQHTRFAAAAMMVDLTGRVLVDFGCGRADFAAFLQVNEVQYGRYVGVEGIAELADAARARVDTENIPECVILKHDFVAEADLYARLVRDERADVFAFSGSLNTLGQRESEATLDRAFDALEPGGWLVFNFLSDRHGDERTGENTGPATRFDTYRFVGWALDRTPITSFRQDYLKGHDATIAMRKP